MKEKLKAIIIDDEKGARDVLHKLLNTYKKDLEVLGSYDSLANAIKPIERQQPDLVFVDVQMPDHYGYEIVNLFDNINFEIIFVTAYDQYAIKAFEVSAIDYLLKPIDRERLSEAIAKVKQKVQTKSQMGDYKKLRHLLDKQTITISEADKKHILKIADVVAIQAKGSYSTIHLLDGSSLLVSKNLRHFENQLGDNFFRSHKSWLINTNQIKEFISKTNRILLNGEVKAKLSKYKRKQFLEILN